ncbi:hypothetical protein NPIL_409181 [Nephila pilipes]|uniref:Uncharacterized protein n=1 Tax=Nephila pilipes TaxID=299642 RepID=A0A8X6QLF3_NEPPI|nr:hypothetical protein NPIL_409181 [Nephila pilipes]
MPFLLSLPKNNKAITAVQVSSAIVAAPKACVRNGLYLDNDERDSIVPNCSCATTPLINVSFLDPIINQLNTKTEVSRGTPLSDGG